MPKTAAFWLVMNFVVALDVSDLRLRWASEALRLVSVQMRDDADGQESSEVHRAVRRLDLQSSRVLFFARLEVSARGAREVEPSHVLLGVLQAAPAAVGAHLSEGWTLNRVAESLDPTRPATTSLEALTAGTRNPSLNTEVPLSIEVMATFARAAAVADRLNSQEIRPEHLLLALLEDESMPAARLLLEAGVTSERILKALQ